MNVIYLDHNATTPLLPAVWEAMRPAFLDAGNAASAHAVGRRARRLLEDARERTASLLGAAPDEVVFTSGATEANNLAVFGLTDGKHVISSPIEHPSVAEPVRQLAERGATVDFLPVTGAGIVEAAALARLLRPDTRLVTVQLVNHETGAVQPVRELARLAERVPFHTDATQAVGKMPVRFHELGVTSLSLSGHKFNGPSGIGALLLRKNTRFRALTWGGHQQQGRRPGTEPVALAVGLSVALELAAQEAANRLARVRLLRQRFLASLQRDAAPCVVNGSADGLPHTLNLSFPGCRSDALLMNLDLAVVACSTGSACSSGSLLPSPVLQAMGVSGDLLHSAMRFSLSHLLTDAEIDEAARRIVSVVRRLREVGESDSG
jgi:cysteine desulfurase